MSNRSLLAILFAARRLIASGGLAVLILGAPAASQGGSWMFRRSYYSHAIPQAASSAYPRPNSRSAYRRAVAGTGFGFAIRGGYRYNRIYLRSGSSTDVTVIREDWSDIRP